MFDLDDVLVDFSEIMYQHIRLNWREYSRYFYDPGDLTLKKLMDRPVYNLNEWLIKKDYVEYTSEQYSALQLKIFSKFIKKFFSTDMYKTANPTEFARKTIMNPIYVESSTVDKIYILSRNITDTQDESKKKFVEKFFSHPKVQYISVRASEKKGETLKRLGIDFDLLVDDEIPNIRNIAEVFPRLDKKEFLIPEYGYNKMPAELQLLIESKGGIITYYNPFKK